MRKKGRSRGRRGGFTLPLAIVGGFVPLAWHAMDDYRVGGVGHVGKGIAVRTTGYMIDSGTFQFQYLKQGLLPILAGLFVHKLASKVGVNRALARSGVPFIRI